MWVFVTIGGATGALARYWLSGWIQGVSGGVFPFGTLVVNVVGCLLLGIGMQGMEALPVSAAVRTMLTIGFLGAFTTFSTFSYETVALLRDGDWTRAGLYTALSVGLGLAAVIAGMARWPPRYSPPGGDRDRPAQLKFFCAAVVCSSADPRRRR